MLYAFHRAQHIKAFREVDEQHDVRYKIMKND